MAYKLRERKRKQDYIDLTSSSDSEEEFNDPDYVQRPPQQRQQQQQQNRNLSSNTNITTQPREVVLVAKIAGFPNTSRRNTSSTDSTTPSTTNNSVRRRPGRPPKPRSNDDPSQDQDHPLVTTRRTRRRRAPFSQRKRDKSCGNNETDKRTVLSMLIDNNIIQDMEGVHYLDMKNHQTVKGQVTRGGITCTCCGLMVTVSGFESHALAMSTGNNILPNDNKPYQNIVLDRNGNTLLQCQVLAWYEGMLMGHFSVSNDVEPKENAKDKSDDACLVCADGGHLICCEKCPSTFHHNCLAMERIPLGVWTCPSCECKYCGSSRGEYDYDLSKCNLCDKTYHHECYDQKELNLNYSRELCGDICNEIFAKLQRIVGVKNQLEGGLSWTLLRHTNLLLFDERAQNNLLYQVIENNSKIAVTWTLMDLSFKRIIDRHSKINVLQSVVYNTSSNLSRVNFKGFYTAILEKGDEIISAASIRIHGKRMAEMPFITTDKNHRGKGMLRKLLAAIESTLCHLEVENLVIPSAEGVEDMWINKFHFSQYIEKALEKDIIHSNMLSFPKTLRLTKTLLPNAQNSQVGGSNSRRLHIFDLNLETTQEDEDM